MMDAPEKKSLGFTKYNKGVRLADTEKGCISIFEGNDNVPRAPHPADKGG